MHKKTRVGCAFAQPTRVTGFPFAGSCPLCVLPFQGFPLGGSCPLCGLMRGIIYPAPHPSLTRHLLPREKAYCPFVILRLAEESNPFRSFADAQDDSKNLFMIKMKPAASLKMTMKPLTSFRMAVKTCSGDIKADCLFFVNASF